MYYTTLDGLILWFDGRKTYLNSLVLVIVPYLVATGVIDANLGAVITAIVGILTGSGKYITDQAVKNNTELGQAIKSKRK